jgi:hypothetical protein
MGATSSFLQTSNGNAATVAVLYTGPNFNGHALRITEDQLAQLENGQIDDLSTIGFLDKALMSMKVSPNYKVKLYTRPERQGNSVSIEGPQDLSDLSNFTNTVSSMKIERVNKSNMQQQTTSIWFWLLLILLIVLILWLIYDSQKTKYVIRV